LSPPPIIGLKRKYFLEDPSSKADAFRFAPDRNFIDNLSNSFQTSKKLKTNENLSSNNFWTDSESVKMEVLRNLLVHKEEFGVVEKELLSVPLKNI
jgi:ferredoxin-thioredoxin reductase catalytic subunit